MPTIMITGANRGIGLELTKQYLARGAKVHACCRNPEEAADLSALAGDITLHSVDVSNAPSITDLAASVDEPLDIVIANAGVYGKQGADQSFANLDMDGFQFALQVNTFGALRTLQAFLPHIKRGQGKRMVAITSKMGSIDDASGGMIAYRASKTALNMAMCCGANELQSEGIALGTLHPGWVKTRMGGDNAPTTPEESALGLIKVIEGLEPGPKAAFKDFRGDTIAW
ncbi:MAG: SDR family oxidoreductase [Parvularculaceae bacterium]|nr:SDR family oxidoreductase [Parvularculaceae bacterium]